MVAVKQEGNFSYNVARGVIVDDDEGLPVNKNKKQKTRELDKKKEVNGEHKIF